MAIPRFSSFRIFFRPIQQLSVQYRQEFQETVTHTNLSRIRALASLLFLLNGALLARDIFVTKASGIWTEQPIYELLFYFHVAFGTITLLFSFSRVFETRTPQIARSIPAVFSWIMLVWAAALVAWVNSVVHGQITEYIVSVFGIAVAFFLPPSISAIVFGSAQIFFMVALASTLNDPNHSGHYTNSIVFSILAWFISSINFSARVREFIDKKIIAEQTVAAEAANATLRERNAQLAQLNDEKNELLGIAAHDLKSPLTGIVMSSDMVVRFYDKMQRADIVREMERISAIATRMSSIITDVLDINALETGKRNYNAEHIDVAPLLRDTTEEYGRRAIVKNIALHTDIREQLPLTIDRNTFVQIIDNLVSNAVKYSPHDKHIWVRADFRINEETPTRPPVLRIEIQDEGPGFTDEDKNKLFGKFARLSAKPTGNEHSTGLGLSIVKQLVENAGGSITCQSTTGQGATFIVNFPTDHQHVPATPL